MFKIITGFVQARGHTGRYIKTNSTGIRRRRKGLPRGTKQAPQGRPTKRPGFKSLTISLPGQRDPRNHTA